MRTSGLSALLALGTLATASTIPTVHTRADAPAPNTYLQFRFQKDSYCTVAQDTPAGPCPIDAEVIPIAYTPNEITGWKEATLNVFNTRVTITNNPFQSPDLYQVIIKGLPVDTVPHVDNPNYFAYDTIDFEGPEQAYDYKLVTSASLAPVPAPITNPTIFRLESHLWCLVDPSVTPQGSCIGVVPDVYVLPLYKFKWLDYGSAELHIKGHNVTVKVIPPATIANLYYHYNVFIDGVLANSLTGENDIVFTQYSRRTWEWEL